MSKYLNGKVSKCLKMRAYHKALRSHSEGFSLAKLEIWQGLKALHRNMSDTEHRCNTRTQKEYQWIVGEKRLIHNLKVSPRRLLLNYKWKCISLKQRNLMVNTLNK